LAAGSVTTMSLVATLTLPSGSTNLVTGADLSPDGTQLAVRTYAGVLLWRRDPAAPLSSAFASPACAGPVPAEAKGEAVVFHADGRGYTTFTEALRATLHAYDAP
jgi:hypothetical protein